MTRIHQTLMLIALSTLFSLSAGADELWRAIQWDRAQDVQQLLENGCDMNMPVQDSTPLGLAVQYNKLNTARLLLEQGAQHTEKDWLLYTAASEGHADMVELLSTHGYDSNTPYISEDEPLEYPLHGAAQYNQVNVIPVLLKHGANINVQEPSEGNTPLHAAAKRNKLRALRTLLKYNPDVNRCNAHGRTPLWMAINHFDTDADMVIELLEHKADPCIVGADGYTSLHRAAEGNCLEAVRLLRQYTPLINAQTRDEGMTPLHYATKKAHVDIMKLLQEKGARDNITDSQGRTAHDYIEQLVWTKSVWTNYNKVYDLMDKIARLERDDAIDILRHEGYDTTTKHPVDLQTVLHYAVKKNYKKIVRSLLAAGADPNARDDFGTTPVEYADNDEMRALFA